MITDILEHCETLEECYEFMLGYAAQGMPGDADNPRVRGFLLQALDSLHRLKDTCAEAAAGKTIEPAMLAFLSVVRRDATDSVAAVELVLAQRAISSQLVDNLNASIHLRAVLTDLFLLTDILRGSNPQNRADA